MTKVLLLSCLLLVFCSNLALASTCSNPVINPSGGTYSSSQQVLLGCPNPADVTIRYTTNGNDPTESDTGVPRGTYITISSSCTLKAKAFCAGWDPSAVTSATFTITGGTVATPTFTLLLQKAPVWCFPGRITVWMII